MLNSAILDLKLPKVSVIFHVSVYVNSHDKWYSPTQNHMSHKQP
jgi:hypothetical protein